MLWVNIILTLLVMGVLTLDIIKPAILFLIAVVIAMFINYPTIEQQKIELKPMVEMP